MTQPPPQTERFKACAAEWLACRERCLTANVKKNDADAESRQADLAMGRAEHSMSNFLGYDLHKRRAVVVGDRIVVAYRVERGPASTRIFDCEKE